MTLTRWTLRRPMAALMSVLAIMLLGTVALFNLELDMLPAINPPVLAVITRLPGATAADAAVLVTKPIEEVAATTAGIKELRSTTREGNSFVVLQFDWETNMTEARAQLAEKLELLPLPDEAGKPQVIKFDPAMMPLMQVFVAVDTGDTLDSVTSNLVDFMERRRHEGAKTNEAAIDAVNSRLRPVLMTALTTIFGLLPLAASLGEGAELQAPLARVVIGGLISATFLTLLIVPVLYTFTASESGN